MRGRKGFITIPLGMWAIYATLAMFAAMFAEMASRTPAPETWF